jgi:two-component system, sensor histidine kinase and response regulator
MKPEAYTSDLQEAELAQPSTRKSVLKAIQQSPLSLSEQASTLEARNRELSAYDHTVAHNLKDPLSVILATADAIFHITDLTPEELRAYLMQIHSTAQSMDEMIDNMLLLSELGEVEPPVGPLNMAEIVSRVRLRMVYQVEQHRARIHYPVTWPIAVGYAPWVEEVWANLISNAIKYGGRPPEIGLGASVRRDGTAMFWVRDNGAGLSEEAQAAMFRPFSQLGPVRTPGHGLGLAIVKRIVERLGGQVGLESQPGRGSRFSFTLPAQP